MTATTVSTNGIMRIGTLLAATLVACGCGLDRQTAPSLVGPSGLALSLTLSASPDSLPRDGASTSVIQAAASGPDGKAVGGQRLILSTSAGSLSVGEVFTGTDGKASFVFTAPALNQGVTEAIIEARPVVDGVTSSPPRSVPIALSGPSVPAAAFTFAPASPALSDFVTFDASTSTLGGTACGATCTYGWTFSDGGTASGQFVEHAFLTAGLQTITLTVTAPGGTSNSLTKPLIVTPPALPVARFTVAPTSPAVNVQVTFNASGSTVGAGVTIVRYVWDFGAGSPPFDSGTVPVAVRTYGSQGTFPVTLTITDSLGRQDSETATVTVVP